MRRMAMMVAIVAALLAFDAGTAFAGNQIIRCSGIPCVATGNDDLIYVNDGDTHDRIYGGKGNDKCYVDGRNEAVSGCSVIIVR